MNNPLLTQTPLPLFNQIKIEHIEPAIDTLITQGRESIENAVNQHKSNPSWENSIEPILIIDDHLDNAWSPVRHLNAVASNEALRKTYQKCIGKLTDYGSEMGQHEGLFNLYQTMAQSKQFAALDKGQQITIKHAIRDFKLAGVSLNQEQKKRYCEIEKQLSELTNKFSDHVLDATDHWELHITDQQRLKGIPDINLAMFKEAAENKNQSGWLLGIDFPRYYAVITFADDRTLREKVYKAYSTRASDQSEEAKQWDNSELMLKILKLRLELAKLLGFEHYAEYSLATKMGESAEQIIEFLNTIAQRAKPIAEAEMQQLQEFAEKQGFSETLQPWDIAYYSEKLKEATFQFSEEDLRPYFPIQKVLSGLFEIVHRIYGITIKEVDTFERWHPDVRLFSIYDANNEFQGQFYLDLFARSHKRGGAWMDECRSRYKTHDGKFQYPVAYLTCNFAPPVKNKPALLTHDEVITLFHEFGHGLHHMLTRVDYLSVSGINGVPWDAVELPSQFHENWCWQAEALPLISEHYETKEPLPRELLDKALRAKNFQAGMFIVRQLEFALFDFRLHLEFKKDDPYEKIQGILDEVRQQVSVVPIVAWNRFQHSFTHVFAGGYAAGYYSYLWAEVLACDAFSLFEENGIFDRKTGQQFLTNILEKGGSEDPNTLFKQFRGHAPSQDAFFKHHGLLEEPL